jgi:hypothetical protein
MPRLVATLLLGAFLLTPCAFVPGQDGKKLSAKEALKAFNDLVGEWKGTGKPKGTPQEVQKGFWVETQDWAWKFKGEDAWLEVSIDKGKYFAKGELRYLPEKAEYQFTVQTTDKKKLVFTGTFVDKALTLMREDGDKKETQKLVFRLLHNNVFRVYYYVRLEDKAFFNQLYDIGAIKQGEAFASGDGRPECIVTGGLGSSAVSYMGKTYYVCCSGCRDEFLAHPEKYIAAAEKKKKQ